MSAADKAVVRRFVDELQTGHDQSVADELLAADFVDHSPFGPLSPATRRDSRAHLTTARISRVRPSS
jgi:hypothetical protein